MEIIEEPRDSWVSLDLQRLHQEEQELYKEAHIMFHFIFAFTVFFVIVLVLMMTLLLLLLRLAASLTRRRSLERHLEKQTAGTKSRKSHRRAEGIGRPSHLLPLHRVQDRTLHFSPLIASHYKTKMKTGSFHGIERFQA